MPDALIVNALTRLHPNICVTFVSYATGAETLRACGKPVIDLRLPEDPPLTSVILAATAVLGAPSRSVPPVIVSHEEFAVLPLARRMRCKSALFLTDWFPPSASIEARCLNYANEIVFLDAFSHDAISPQLSCRVQYVGPVHGVPLPSQRKATRSAMGVTPTTAVVLVSPGGNRSHSEDVTPLRDVMLDAWEMLPMAERLLLWVADEQEEERLLRTPRARSIITIIRPQADFMSLLEVCDLLITKANRITTLEADGAGIPSLSISFGVNPVDDRRLASISNNVSLSIEHLTRQELSSQLLRGLQRGRRLRQHRLDASAGAATLAAIRIAEHSLPAAVRA